MFRYLLWLFSIFFVVTVSNVYGEGEDWIPSSRSYSAASQGRECAIYRSLVTKTRLSLVQNEDAELHFSELLKVRRADLVACAQLHHVKIDGTTQAEELAAEACDGVYQKWIETGYRYRANQQDEQNAKKAEKILVAQLTHSCGRPAEMVPAVVRIQ